MPTELLLIYNADSGFFNAAFSSIHKAISPGTYSCSLCRVSHNLTGMLGSWRCYLESLPLPVRALHRDQFQKAFPDQTARPLPAILLHVEGGFNELLSAEKIEQASNILTLINLLEDALTELNQNLMRKKT